MANFQELQDEVSAQVVDLPPSVSAYVASLVNEAIRDCQTARSWFVMQAVHTATTVAATHTPTGTFPANWKQPRKRPWYATQAGARVPLDWIGQEDEEIFKVYGPEDLTNLGAPRGLFLRPSQPLGVIALEVYPFSDGQSDWTASPVGQYRLVMPYYGYLPDLAAAGDTNWFSVNARRYIVEQATGNGFLKNWDEKRAAVHFQQATAALKVPIKINTALVLAGRGDLTPRADVYGPRTGGTNRNGYSWSGRPQ